MSIGAFLPQVCTIQRKAVGRSRDAYGTETDIWGDLLTGVPCMIQAASANERGMMGASGVEVTHRLFCESLSDNPTEADRILVGTATYYEIEMVDNPAGLGDHLEIMLREIRQGGYGEG